MVSILLGVTVPLFLTAAPVVDNPAQLKVDCKVMF